MTSAAAQLQFAAQLAVLLVAVVGLSLALRQDLLSPVPGARSLLGAGFLALAAAALMVGSQLVTDPGAPALVALRTGGALLVGAGTVRWRWSDGRRVSGQLSGVAMLGGVVLVLAAEPARATGAGRAADVLSGIGALLLGAALVVASRRSIPARIGADATALLLVVLLAVSLALSVVVTRNVEDEALRRYDSRVARVADATVATAEESLGMANLLSAELARSYGPDLAVLADPAADPAAQRAAAERISSGLAALVSDEQLDISRPVLYVDPSGASAAVVPAMVDTATRQSLGATPAVTEALSADGPRQAVSVVGDRAYAVAAVPVVIRPAGAPDQPVGVVAVATPLDETYLHQVDRGGEPLALALATPEGVIATAGATPSAAELESEAARVLEGDGTRSGIVGSRFVVARPVVGPDRATDLVVVASVPTSAVDDTRTDLFRTLFLIALGAALVAVALALLAGNRIGRGVGRLAAAAERIERGDLSARTGVTSDDELGALGATFDSMAGSLRTMTTDLREAAADEARLRGRLSAVIGSMTEALLAAGADGRVIECNPAAERLLGISAADVVGRSLDEVLLLRDADSGASLSLAPPRGSGGGAPAVRVGEALVSSVSNGDPATDRPVSFSAAAVTSDGGGPTGTVVVLRDLRPEREIEDMKTQFLANISHELRTPLTPIKGYAAALRRGRLDPTATVEVAEQIGVGAAQLERVIDQLVNFATMAAGRLNLRPGPADGSLVVHDATERWAMRVDGQQRIRPSVARGLPELTLDRRYIDQALDELLDNAVKFSPEGGDIVVAAEPAEPTEGVDGIRFSVTDQGVGLDPERGEQLTAAFAQGDASATRRFGGLGLGLALVDRIARAHGGRLAWESTEAGGTRFSILLPVPADQDGGLP